MPHLLLLVLFIQEKQKADYVDHHQFIPEKERKRNFDREEGTDLLAVMTSPAVARTCTGCLVESLQSRYSHRYIRRLCPGKR